MRFTTKRGNNIKIENNFDTKNNVGDIVLFEIHLLFKWDY
jgi:hypothetical protein